MKTVLWASLSANGSYLRATSDTPPDAEVLEDIYTRAKAAGCVVFGRVTHDELTSRGEDPAALGVDVIVVSRRQHTRERASIATDPKQAIEQLRTRDHSTVLVCGGAELLNAFLAEDLADEVIFNYTPNLISSGMHVSLAKNSAKALELLDRKELGRGIVQMSYALGSK